MHGYFVDGMIYASLARNLAEGYGSFWDMRLSDGLFRHFHEHPPLGIYIQSLFYRLFGDTELIDKYYGFILGFGILALIVGIRGRIYSDARGAWFALLAFVLFPITGYVLSYNWLEHIFTFTILLTAFVALLALYSESGLSRLVLGLLAGGLLFSGVMIKGPAALYPLSVPFFAWLFLDRVGFKRATAVLALMAAGLVLCVGVFILPSDQASAYMANYLSDQVMGSLNGERSVHGHTRLLESLLTEELVAPLAVFSLLMWLSRTGWKRLNTDNRFWFFLSVALSGSLPLMISPKQNDYYLFIAMPFYALAIAALFEPLRISLEERVTSGRRLIVAATVLLLLTPVVMLSKQGEYRKDKAYHQSFTETGIVLPRRSTVSACPQATFFADWNLLANFQRYHAVTLTRESGSNYLVTTAKDAQKCLAGGRYRRVSQSDTPYLLFQREAGGVPAE